MDAYNSKIEPLLKDLKLTIGSDPTGTVTRAFGVITEEEGIGLKGRFLINPEGTVIAQEVQALMVGRSVVEFLRQIKAWQHATETNEVYPVHLKQVRGRVGDYITIEEVLS